MNIPRKKKEDFKKRRKANKKKEKVPKKSKKLFKSMKTNLLRAYEVAAQLDSFSVVTREMLDQRYSSPTSR